MLERSQAFVKSRCLHDQLPLSPEERRAAIQRIQQASNAQWPKSALDVALAMWREAECTVAMLVLDEVESLVLDDAIALGAFIGYRRLPAPPRGDPTDSPGMAWLQSDGLTPSVAVALAVKAGAPIYLRREIYDDTLCDLARRGGGGGGDADDGECKTDWCVDPAQAASWRPPQSPRQLIQRAERGLTQMQLQEQVRQPVWEMRAADVLTLGQEQLRFLLRQYSVPTRRRESVADMTEKVLPLMDEVQRRIILIRRAVDDEDFYKASALAAGTSSRGRLSEELVQAVRDERYEDAAEIQEQLEAETMGRADITQEPGSYDPFLDADDWYIRDLMRSQKRSQ